MLRTTMLINHLQRNGAELELPPVATFLRRDRSHTARGRLGQSIRTDPARPQSTPPSIIGTIFRGLSSNAAAQTVANVSLATQPTCPTHGPACCHGNPVAQEDSHGREATANTVPPSYPLVPSVPELQTPPPCTTPAVLCVTTQC